MGLVPPLLALYREMKKLGGFDGVTSVLELGAQTVWCPRAALLASLFEAFERPAPDAATAERYAQWRASARELYEALGFRYRCVDLDPSFDSVRMDLNFDAVPPAEAGRYDLVTNHGTSEHVFNQQNCFRVMHDFCRPGGLMLHAVPFLGYVEHGFFNYQPNLFLALARYNGYDTLGMWIGPDWQLGSLIPWEPGVLDVLALRAATTHLIVVVQRKRHDAPFAVPLQQVYETAVPEEAFRRYSLVVDGETLDGGRARRLGAVPDPARAAEAPPSAAQLSKAGGRALARALARRVLRRLSGG